MSEVLPLTRAGQWFLHSGIQEPSGGVARFHRADLHANKPVSTEITGYVASTLIFLFRATKDEVYLDRARRTAAFLCDHAWDDALGTFPFEHPSPSDSIDHHAYFFDCGIIIRGLLAVWRETREDRLLDLANQAAHGMIADFHSGSDYHPILNLPEKQPLTRQQHWSRMPGCYQLKSALAWLEVANITGDGELSGAYFEMLEDALRAHRDFLPGTPARARVMDRLHAYCYFLEAISPALDRSDCVEAYRYGLDAASHYLRDIAPEFARSDVYAQLLRARVYGAAVVPVDMEAAREEAQALAAFQTSSEDPRVDGAFLFGRRDGELIPHANPVSTAFAIQALEVWRAFETGKEDPCRLPPI
ncbi:MAG TPA: hypothetical protein VHB50_22735 [Bryobacteraceae bacterium]|nr:hypothetical protein [Bryobacteraceae bacterium]